VLTIVVALALGLFAGSLVLEGLVLVPFWRTLPPDEFFRLHHAFGPRLFRYFAPLTALAVLVSLASALIAHPTSWQRVAAAGCAALTLAAFPLFFARANREFAHRSITDAQLPRALDRWAMVHMLRTATCVLAFVFALLALTP
jgi:hypothetical protein